MHPAASVRGCFWQHLWVPDVLLLTTENLIFDEPDTPLLAAALAGRGVRSRTLPWTDPSVTTTDVDLVIIRSTWDYPAQLRRFLATLHGLPGPVCNPPAVVRWNAHKSYLTQLAAVGVPVVPTMVVPAGSAVLPELDAAEIIVKPAVSAGAVGVGRFGSGSPAAAHHLGTVTASGDALVQPFVPEVVHGERSLIFLDGRFSHAVRKVPAGGDFRVQVEHGGTASPVAATDADLALARRALDAVPELLPGSGPLLYGRVDVVGPADAPMVMELELIEPQLFLDTAPGSADLLADGVLTRL